MTKGSKAVIFTLSFFAYVILVYGLLLQGLINHNHMAGMLGTLLGLIPVLIVVYFGAEEKK